jgi:anti-sigma factor RsiW
MEKSCKDIEEVLVDYADGLLGACESEQVAEHLAGCSECRELLKGLRKSLGLVEVIWEDNVAEAAKIAVPQIRRVRKRTWRRYVSAASIVVIGSICLMHFRKEPAAAPVLSYEEIERKISEAGSAARLLAAAELLSEREDFENLVRQQYRYLIESYPESSSGDTGEQEL